ncbi:hypothetical protein RclHR1_00180028 [Rhizophagus clarus]|uniref:Uncharacterized protein n=1 Tax=Rhizophagus clarus TaxID=94130 RepID=A0A2Z6QLJ0_9GLOM|nr:hypothetical protein RclHR1_00180028 [Rhizophagus clarus]GES73053.1 hypothetical protein GLOIN_2v1880782 [Rhizophagus clarus]
MNINTETHTPNNVNNLNDNHVVLPNDHQQQYDDSNNIFHPINYNQQTGISDNNAIIPMSNDNQQPNVALPNHYHQQYDDSNNILHPNNQYNQQPGIFNNNATITLDHNLHHNYQQPMPNVASNNNSPDASINIPHHNNQQPTSNNISHPQSQNQPNSSQSNILPLFGIIITNLDQFQQVLAYLNHSSTKTRFQQ